MTKYVSWKDRLAAKLPKLKWWQIIVIIATALILFSGMTIKTKWFSCEKQPIKVKSEAKKK